MKIKNIFEAVESVTGVPKNEITGDKRFKKIMLARHLFCYFAKKKTPATLLEIGNNINRHHSTVINSLELISDMIDIDDEVTKDYLNKIDSYIEAKFQQPKKLEIFLPYDADIKKVRLYLENEHRAIVCAKS